MKSTITTRTYEHEPTTTRKAKADPKLSSKNLKAHETMQASQKSNRNKRKNKQQIKQAQKTDNVSTHTPCNYMFKYITAIHKQKQSTTVQDKNLQVSTNWGTDRIIIRFSKTSPYI